jgi:hypothetical protein
MLCATALVLAAAPLSAQGAIQGPSATVLADDSSLFRVSPLRLDDGSGNPLGPSALVLETVSPAGEGDVAIVPSTEDEALDLAPMVFYQRGRDRLAIVWESRETEPETVRIRMIEQIAGVWTEAWDLLSVSDPLDLVSHGTTLSPFTLQLPDGRRVFGTREVVHFAWWAEADGSVTLHHLPVVFHDGAFVAVGATNEILGFIESAGTPGTDPPSDRLRSTISLHAIGGRTLTASFLDPRNLHVVGADLSVGALEVDAYAQNVRAKLLTGLDAGQPLSDAFMTDLISSGFMTDLISSGNEVGLDDVLSQYLAETAATFTSGFFELNPNTTAGAWADALESFVKDLLASIFATDATGEAFGIDLNAGSNMLGVNPIFTAVAPATGEGATRIYVGAGGKSVVIGWYEQETETVLWVESTRDPASPWTAPRALLLDAGLDLDQADALLRQRVQ